MTRFFQATVTDSDGESHEYHFTAPDLWAVGNHIAEEMARAGDFYGHKRADTIQLDIAERISGAPDGIHSTDLSEKAPTSGGMKIPLPRDWS